MGWVLEFSYCLVRQGGVGVMIGRSGDGVLQDICRRRVRWKGWSTRVKPEGEWFCYLKRLRVLGGLKV